MGGIIDLDFITYHQEVSIGRVIDKNEELGYFRPIILPPTPSELNINISTCRRLLHINRDLDREIATYL